MTSRSKIGNSIIAEVLLKSRRRCCICFGLNRDTNIKNGQIAHLDRDRSNNEVENLAFLCLDHHDEYDSRTSQRKGLALNEVKHFRHELETNVFQSFTREVHFGTTDHPPNDPYAGRWIRVDSGSNSAELILTPLPDCYEGYIQYYVNGVATWEPFERGSPNLGIIESLGRMYDPDILTVQQTNDFITICNFYGDILIVDEPETIGHYGHNANFRGTYRRS